jgi:hypothetical protein
MLPAHAKAARARLAALAVLPLVLGCATTSRPLPLPPPPAQPPAAHVAPVPVLLRHAALLAADIAAKPADADPPASPSPLDPRRAALRDAAAFGVIGIIAALPPHTRWPEHIPALDAAGDSYMAVLAQADAARPLDLSGIGSGAGAAGPVILAPRLDVPAFGESTIPLYPGRPHAAGPPLHAVTCADSGPDGCHMQIKGAMPRDVVQRVVRANFGRFRACYAAGLRKDPALAGRLSIRFLIDTDGAVVAASLADDALPDPAVAACVVRAFYGLSFPATVGAEVTVTYPLRFSPTD